MNSAGSNGSFEEPGSEQSSRTSHSVSEHSSQSPEALNWPDLMETLKDCGFEMPLGSLVL